MASDACAAKTPSAASAFNSQRTYGSRAFWRYEAAAKIKIASVSWSCTSATSAATAATAKKMSFWTLRQWWWPGRKSRNAQPNLRGDPDRPRTRRADVPDHSVEIFEVGSRPAMWTAPGRAARGRRL